MNDGDRSSVDDLTLGRVRQLLGVSLDRSGFDIKANNRPFATYGSSGQADAHIFAMNELLDQTKEFTEALRNHMTHLRNLGVVDF